jgi:hypothetical protein
MDEQLVQSQTIETLRRQVETSNNSAQQAQALLRANQEQQLQNNRMPPPTTYPGGAGGIIGNTPFLPPVSTPSTGMRTRELHGPGYYHIGSPADPGYAEHMRSMYGRDDMDPPRQDPPRHEPPSIGSSSRGSSSQISQGIGWQSRAGQNIPAFPGSRVIPTRRVDSRDTTLQRMLKFGQTKAPKLSKANLVNTEVHHLIQYINQLLHQEAFHDSVLINLIDSETINVLGYVFQPTETASRHPITTHWTVDWDVATVIEALEELYPLQAEHKHLDIGSRWQQIVDKSVSRVRVQSDNMERVRSDTIYEWSSGASTIGPIPRNQQPRVLKSLAQSFTHRDNPYGNSNPNIAFQRDLDEALEADEEYRNNPSLPRLCQLLADLAYKWEKIESQS